MGAKVRSGLAYFFDFAVKINAQGCGFLPVSIRSSPKQLWLVCPANQFLSTVVDPAFLVNADPDPDPMF
jgi:hypothetical protein